ncbi:hypothetical protein BKM31_17720 [[Actinomadura] parvosata subsp. kistnae]|uniref:Uncharacterized protein n=1 Tax=[Actinomadura] parvosata subsp. kistnae TaxID=1909395 RepID=A0A1U9ZYM2_9ACTN|nr:hypothetical protein BKM31_17720 [Nonomuraea sp. ATCC 55076]
MDTHTAAVVDLAGRVLGTVHFPATAAGCAALLAWMRSFGQLDRGEVVDSGVYGAALTCLLKAEHIDAIEIPNRTAGPAAFWASLIRSMPSPPQGHPHQRSHARWVQSSE